jgi:threonine/homoserine/homoserine lactone efflux protein
MNLIDILALVLLMITLALVPGASTVLVVARSATNGFANGAAATAGIVLGDFVFLTVAVLGMAALAEMMGSLFMLVRILAGACLIWMGINLLRSAPPENRVITETSVSNLGSSFLAGLLITLGDIKAILFYASLLPVFLDMNSLRAYDVASVYLVTLATVGGIKLGYAYAAKTLFLHGRSAMGRVARGAAGSLLAGAGTFLIIKT